MIPIMGIGVMESELIEEDIVSTFQFLSIYSNGRKDVSPERRLIATVLLQTLEDITRYHNSKKSKERNRFLDSVSYVESEDKLWPYSFNNLCDTMNLDADYVRSGIRKYYNNL